MGILPKDQHTHADSRSTDLPPFNGTTSKKENARLKWLLTDAELDSGVSRGSIGTPLGGPSQLLSLFTVGGERSSTLEVFLAVID